MDELYLWVQTKQLSLWVLVRMNIGWKLSHLLGFLTAPQDQLLQGEFFESLDF